MEINKISKAGTVESNDIYIVMMPNTEGGIDLDLESIVMKQFGDDIRRVILDTLENLEVKDAIIKAQDKGALDYTIKARVETAVKRAQ
jgi:citrate lyase subunit gamma (acyl carrier protein)